MLQRASFKETSNRSHFRVIRDLEYAGASSQAAMGRDFYVTSADCHVDSIPTVLEVLGDSVLNPQLNEYHFGQLHKAAVADAVEAEANSSEVLGDAIHAASFATGVGASINPGSHIVASRTAEDVALFHSSNVDVAGNIVVAAVGVDHAEFVSQATKGFGALPSAQGKELPQSTFQQREARVSMGGAGFVDMAIGFNGVSWSSSDLVPMVVLNMLLGGGDSFSSGGPGKGMTSKLYANVVNKLPFVVSASALAHTYSNAGLFVLNGSGASNGAEHLLAALAGELKSVAGGVAAGDFERAVNATASMLLINSEHCSMVLEDLGRQALGGNEHVKAEVYLNQIRSLKAADVERVAQNLIKGGISFAAAGDTSAVPSYDRIVGLFK